MVDREPGGADLALPAAVAVAVAVAVATATATVDHRPLPLPPQDRALIRRPLTAVVHRGHLHRDPTGGPSAAQGATVVVVPEMVIGSNLVERESDPTVEAEVQAEAEVPTIAVRVIEVEIEV